MIWLCFNLCLIRGTLGGSVGFVLDTPTIPPGAKPGNLAAVALAVFFCGTLTKFLVHPRDELRWEI